jgi:hypothetical protein
LPRRPEQYPKGAGFPVQLLEPALDFFRAKGVQDFFGAGRVHAPILKQRGTDVEARYRPDSGTLPDERGYRDMIAT